MFNKLKRILKKNGLFGGIKYIINKLSGKAALIESIDTLYYFLEKTVDITKFPKATGSLRDLQLCDAELLKIFHLACEKNNLKYWLDHGTLLGAVRHKGFIPWDDDLDISMPREDYERALEILPNEFAEYGIDVGEFSFRPLVSFGFSIKHRQTGIWIDVFPVDRYYCKDKQEELALRKQICKYQKFYRANKLKKTRQQLLDKKHKYLKTFEVAQKDKDEVLCHSIEFLYPKLNLYYGKDVFPLTTHKFEDFEYCVPNDYCEYLSNKYGSNYMGFPKGGLEHHGEDADKLKNWAAANNVDMKEILAELNKISQEYLSKG